MVNRQPAAAAIHKVGQIHDHSSVLPGHRYNLGGVEDGERLGEKNAHYCEFAFEIISSLVTFVFCVDNKIVADNELQRLLYGEV